MRGRKSIFQLRNFGIGAIIGVILVVIAHLLPALGRGSTLLFGVLALCPLLFTLWDSCRIFIFFKKGYPRPLSNQWRWVATVVIGLALVYLVNHVEHSSSTIFKEDADLVLVKAYLGAKLHLLFTLSFFWAFSNPDKEWERRVIDATKL